MSFTQALEHAMLYEVGPWFDINKPGVKEGLIATKEQRKQVGYVNDPNDRGGETKFGVAAKANPDLNIKELTWDAAQRVYYKRYWVPGDCDAIPCPGVALWHFDCCVNHGIGRAAKFIQAAVKVKVDGDIGPKTIEAMKAFNQTQLLDAVLGFRLKFYADIIANDPTQAKFSKGWQTRAYDVYNFAKSIKA